MSLKVMRRPDGHLFPESRFAGPKSDVPRRYAAVASDGWDLLDADDLRRYADRVAAFAAAVRDTALGPPCPRTCRVAADRGEREVWRAVVGLRVAGHRAAMRWASGQRAATGGAREVDRTDGG